MIFIRHDDGTVTVDRFDETCTIGAQFLAFADPNHVSLEDDLLTLRCANGTAVYRLTARPTAPDERGQIWDGVRVEPSRAPATVLRQAQDERRRDG